MFTVCYPHWNRASGSRIFAVFPMCSSTPECGWHKLDIRCSLNTYQVDEQINIWIKWMKRAEGRDSNSWFLDQESLCHTALEVVIEDNPRALFTSDRQTLILLCHYPRWAAWALESHTPNSESRLHSLLSLDKLLNFPVPQFPHLYRGGMISEVCKD